MKRREVPYARPAGRQANATQEAFARARSVWPRRGPTTGPDRGRTSSAEVARRRPKPSCAGPPGRARACRVLCGPFWVLALFPSLPLTPFRSSLLFTTLLDARSLTRLRARHSLFLSLSLFLFVFSVQPVAFAVRTVSWLGPSCEDEVVPKKRRARDADSGASIEGRREHCDNYHEIYC